MRTNVPKPKGVCQWYCKTEIVKVRRTIFLVHGMNNLRSVTTLAHPTQPSIRELGREWSGIPSIVVWVENIRNEVRRDNEDGDADGKRLPVKLLVHEREDT